MASGSPSDPASLTARQLSVLFVHSELPTYDRQSGSLRMWRYLEVMVAEGHRVTFLARAGFGQERYVDELRALGVEVHPIDARFLRAAGYAVPGLGFDLPMLLKRGRFDIAYLNFYEIAEQYLPQIRVHSPATRIIIDTHDVHYLRERRGAELTGDRAALEASERTRAREAAIYSQADLLTAVSHDDAAALRELAPEVPVEIVSNIHVEVPDGPAFEQRAGLVFVANFDHAPNVDAILDFHSTAWPLIAQAVPDARLAIVGYAPPPAVRALHGERIAVTGQVPEVAPYLDAARVSIAPLRYGAGVKGKIGEALMHGLPVVTTPIGAEGMDLEDGEHVLIAQGGEAFAGAVVRLYGDRALWARISEQGRAHIRQRHGTPAALTSLRRAFASALPACLVADVPAWTPAAAGALVRGYLCAFTESDPVSLVVPVTPADPEAQTVCDLLAEAIQEAGADPDHVPDIRVMPCAKGPPVPANAARFDGSAPSPAEPARPPASIIIPAHGKREMTEMCLAALERELGPRLGGEIELVLVDNRSPDSTLELFRQWSPRAIVVELPENRNFAGGVNAGARVARGDVLLVVSTDMELGPGAVDAMIAEAQQPGVGLVGVRMCYPDGRLQHAGIGWRSVSYGLLPFHLFHYEPGALPLARARFEIGMVTGGCIAVRADLFRLVGGFDEGYVNGWEDADLCLQVRSAGAAVRYLGDVEIVHHEGVTSGGRYNGDGNPRRFFGRWSPMLGDDSAFMRDCLGAGLSPIIDLPVPDDDPAGADLRIVGQLAGIGPCAAEARGMLRALRRGGVDVAARTVAPTWIGPPLDEPRWRELAQSHARAARPGATTVSFGEADELAGDRYVLRVGAAVARPSEETIAWVPCPAVSDALLSEGWPAEAIEIVPPVGIEVAPGAGGGGALVCLPTHDRALTGALLAALAGPDARPVRVLPSVRTPDLQRVLRESLPQAELLSPTTDERAFAALAGQSDLVVSVDPADCFDRLALTAAGAGAAVIVRAGGPAAWVLGELACTADPCTGSSLAAALAGDGHDASAEARRARTAAVEAACGIPAGLNWPGRLLAGR